VSAPIRARLGALYEQQLDAAGANMSAALRAYLLLGMAAAGVEMTPFRREIARSLSDDLAPEVLAALAQIGLSRAAVAAPAPAERECVEPPADTAQDALEADPLLAVGLDV
jgi:hypothetical protein